jgi:hypothetical protein
MCGAVSQDLCRLPPCDGSVSGLDHDINYQAGDFVAAIHALTQGHGADLIVDSVGGARWSAASRQPPTADASAMWPMLPRGRQCRSSIQFGRTDYSLIVDGTAVVASREDGHRLLITPTKAVLHRPAAAPDPASPCGADCVPLLPR